MKYLLFALFIASLGFGRVYAQGNRQSIRTRATPEQMARIRQEYAEIDSRSKRYAVRRRENDEGNSATTYTGYYENAVPRKITVESSGERDVYVTNFYLRNSRVFFVHRITTRFESIASNTGVRSEERFYFANGKLIRYLGDKNVVQPVDDASARDNVKELSSLQQEAVDMLKKKKA